MSRKNRASKAIKRGDAPGMWERCHRRALCFPDAAAMARAITVAAAWPSATLSPTGSSSFRAPVDAAKIRSPSKGVWLGTSARAKPSCAATASRWHCALSSAASVAMIPMVVFWAGSGRRTAPHRFRHRQAPGRGRQFTALFPWRGPQMRHPVRRRRAMRVHRDQRADRHPLSSTAEADPRPPFRGPAVAPVPAPAVPSANASPRPRHAAAPSAA